jgi:hypothetical protein
MAAKSPQAAGQVVPLDGNALRRRSASAARSSGASLVTVDAGRQMAKIERMFAAAGNPTRQVEALATLRRWELDPRLDDASRARAGALVWKFQPNGWDEV